MNKTKWTIDVSDQFDIVHGFGELREFMHRNTLCDDAEDFYQLVWRAYKTDEKHYKQIWLPYINSFTNRWFGFALGECAELSDLQELVDVAPFAQHWLDITYMPLSDLKHVAERLLGYVRGLSLDGGDHSLQRIELVADSPHTSAIRELAVSLTGLSMYLAQHVTAFTGLEYLSLSANEIDEEDVWSMGKVEKWGNLRQLELSYNHLYKDGLAELALWRCLKRVEMLDLTSTNASDAGIIALAASETIESLKTLKLEDNSLTAACVGPLCEARYFSELRHVNLSANHIDDQGVQVFTQFLDRMQGMRLDLSGNPVSRESLEMLRGGGVDVWFYYE